jgi:cell division protein FtsQ
MKRIITISFTVVLLAGMIVLLGFIRNEHSNAVCRGIRVSIDYRSNDTLVSSNEVEQLINAKFDTLKGKRIEAEKLANIMKTISGIPYVESCDVDFLLNGILRIRARQRVPVLRVMVGSNSWFIDKEGIVMPRHRTFSARVPIASGHLGQTSVLKNGNNLQALADTNTVFARGRLNQALKLAQFIHHDNLLNSMVEQIYVNPQGEIELFTHVGNQRILFGDAENIEDKFNRLIIFYRAGPSVTGLDQYKTINLKYNNQVVCSNT